MMKAQGEISKETKDYWEIGGKMNGKDKAWGEIERRQKFGLR